MNGSGILTKNCKRCSVVEIVISHNLYASLAQQLKTIGYAVLTMIDKPLDASLYDEFSALEAARIRAIERCTLATGGRSRYLRNGIALSVQNLPLRHERLTSEMLEQQLVSGERLIVTQLALVWEASGCTIVSVTDYLSVLDYQSTYLESYGNRH